MKGIYGRLVLLLVMVAVRGSVDVAVLLSGQLRGFISKGNWLSWGSHVVDVFASQSLTVGTWLCTDKEHDAGYVNATVQRRLNIEMK